VGCNKEPAVAPGGQKRTKNIPRTAHEWAATRSKQLRQEEKGSCERERERERELY